MPEDNSSDQTKKDSPQSDTPAKKDGALDISAERVLDKGELEKLEATIPETTDEEREKTIDIPQTTQIPKDVTVVHPHTPTSTTPPAPAQQPVQSTTPPKESAPVSTPPAPQPPVPKPSETGNQTLERLKKAAEEEHQAEKAIAPTPPAPSEPVPAQKTAPVPNPAITGVPLSKPSEPQAPIQQPVPVQTPTPAQTSTQPPAQKVSAPTPQPQAPPIPLQKKPPVPSVPHVVPPAPPIQPQKTSAQPTVTPITSEEKKEESAIPRLRTYKDDVARAIKNQKASLASITAAEQERRGSFVSDVPKKTIAERIASATKTIAQSIPTQKVEPEVEKTAPKETPEPIIVPEEPTLVEPKIEARIEPQQEPRETPKEPPRDIQRDLYREIPEEKQKNVPEEIPREVPKVIEREVEREIPKEIPRELPKETPKATPIVKKPAVKKHISVPLPQAPSKESVKNIGKWLLIGVSVLLVFGGVGVFGYFLFFYEGEKAPTITQDIPTLLFVNDTKEVDTTGRNARQVLQELRGIKNTTSSTIGNIVQLYPTEIVDQENRVKKLLSTQEFLTLIQADVRDSFLRSLDPIMTMGLHVFDGNQPFILITINSYQQAFAGMLEWERSIYDTLEPFFGTPAPIQTATPTDQTATSTATTTPTSVPLAPRFIDKVVRNVDVRSLQRGQEKPLLLYAFPNQKTLIITTDENTLTEVITRLNTSRVF